MSPDSRYKRLYGTLLNMFCVYLQIYWLCSFTTVYIWQNSYLQYSNAVSTALQLFDDMTVSWFVCLINTVARQ